MKEDTPLQDSNTWPFQDGDMLTSIDNPYNPKEDFGKWYIWDITNGYNTSEYIARLANYEDSDDEEELKRKYYESIQFIIENNEDLYKIV